jgi:Asp-tRNA(Asn)/Glu-tRNA(Gln) amidotransferase A subunit family amidase
MTGRRAVAGCLPTVEASLGAIETGQSRLNAFTAVLSEGARIRAMELDVADRSGPLHGVPVAVKDLFDVAGVPTTGSCTAFLDRAAATQDAAVVAALRAAGAVVVGKTNQHELGAGATGLVSAYGPVRNPWDEQRIPGGSSSGSAVAVATGMVPVAIGSDTGGSIRIPASFCGITGLKPTWGRVNLRGAMPLNPFLDTAGPLARTAAECGVVFRVLAGGGGPSGVPLARLRIGWPETYCCRVHPDTMAALEVAARRLEGLGAVVVVLDARDGPLLDEEGQGFAHTWSELAAAFPALVDDPRVHPEVAALLRIGREMPVPRYEESRVRAGEVRQSFEGALEKVDVLLTPATPYPAPSIHATEVSVTGGTLDVHRGGPSRLTAPVNLAGLPAVAFPIGFSADGLPLGAQLIGRPFDEETLLAAVQTFQSVTDHHNRRPPAG